MIYHNMYINREKEYTSTNRHVAKRSLQSGPKINCDKTYHSILDESDAVIIMMKKIIKTLKEGKGRKGNVY